MPTRPNVILVCVDQWRRNCLGIAGHPVVRTPTLDALATAGVRFTRAYSATPTCVPARATLLTGLDQNHTGRIGYRDGVEWNFPVTIVSEFTDAGYQTEAIGKLHVCPERSQVGFQHVQLHDGFLHHVRGSGRDSDRLDDYLPWLQREVGYGADYFDHGVDCNGVEARPWDKPEYTHPTNRVMHQAIDFLRRRDSRKPFFLYLGFHRPHPPYDPPAWAFEAYLNEAMPDPPIGDWIDILEPHRNHALNTAFVAHYPPSVLQRARAGYYGHMTHIDQQLNRLREYLLQYGVAQNTWICFTSDHGELMGDHDMYRKGLPYEGSAGIPLILTPPPGVDFPRGTTSDALVELRDVMPTLLDCAGLPAPDEIDGVSVLPSVADESVSLRPWLHGEHLILGQSIQWLTDGHQKYIWWSETGREQLFDLDADPQECHDRFDDADHVAVLETWRARLVGILADREDGLSDGTQLLVGRPTQAILPGVIAALADQAAARLATT